MAKFVNDIKKGVFMGKMWTTGISEISFSKAGIAGNSFLKKGILGISLGQKFVSECKPSAILKSYLPQKLVLPKMSLVPCFVGVHHKFNLELAQFPVTTLGGGGGGSYDYPPQKISEWPQNWIGLQI